MTGTTNDLQADAACRPFRMQQKTELKLANRLAITAGTKALVGAVVNVLADKLHGTIAKNKLRATNVI